MEDWTFVNCENLVSATLGTGFATETKINFGREAFSSGNASYLMPTEKIKLTLGENVLPKPDLDKNTWQKTNSYTPYVDYIWKNITIKNNNGMIIETTDGIEEIIKNSTVSVFPNPTVGNATVSFELEKSCNVKIVLCDILGIEQIQVFDGFAIEGLFIETIDTEHLPKGVYFLKILIDGNYTVKKIVLM